MLGIKIISQSSGKDRHWYTTNVNKLLTLTFEIESLCSLEKVKGEWAHYIVYLSHTMSTNLCLGYRYSLRQYCNHCIVMQ